MLSLTAKKIDFFGVKLYIIYKKIGKRHMEVFVISKV